MPAKAAFAATLACLLATSVAAAPEDPVREVMSVTVSNWAGDAPFQDLFSQERLDRLFSDDFKAAYARAMTTPDAEEMGTPFDYDVVVNAQDGCPLRDVTIAPAVSEGDATVVDVRFRFLTCSGEPPANQAWSETQFVIVDEAGKDRIDDIIATNPEGMTLSARDQLDAVTDTSAD
ncbi:hypothetical protein TM49_09210 [Martelella endophytica]|uniref:DUF3828 domain-containing protein n=1 Tax=Martelella endophytica TaxID=1486262 RepID=A0A0D5LUY5_MAREN|nr:hypothetical protein TM49_09210 [Martelella endophytica]